MGSDAPPAVLVEGTRTFWLLIEGPMAYWGGIRTGASGISQAFPSHSAVEGIYRTIMGHPGARWRAVEARLMRLGGRTTVTSRELESLAVGSPRGPRAPRNTDDMALRTMRTRVCLVDVAYAICARLAAPSADDLIKYERMFLQRAAAGRLYARRPTLGMSEMYAEWELVTDPSALAASVDLTEDFGICWHDRDWGRPGAPLCYAPMRAEHGIVRYPSWDEVRALGIERSAA
jgi:hypothetical protein